MSSEKQCLQNRQYYRAIEYIKNLHHIGLISEKEMTNANEYYANFFNVKVQLYL